MKKRKRLMGSRTGTMLLAGAAVVLLLTGGVGTTRAALTYYSENYTAQMELKNIGVTLVETSAQGTKDISNRDYTGTGDEWNETTGELLTDMLKESGDKLKLGQAYTEELSVRNTGTIDEYVRVRIYKSWTDPDGGKNTSLSPSLIALHLTENGWILDEASSTEERTVLYWPKILKTGASTAALCDTLTIDSSIANKVTKETVTENGVTQTTTAFKYDGVKFHLQAEVDAVQTHNAADAIKSAWGVDVNVADDGSISLK